MSAGARTLGTGRSKRAEDTARIEEMTGVELEQLVAKEVDMWRSEVDRSRDPNGLRHRGNASGSGNALDEVRIIGLQSASDVVF